MSRRSKILKALQAGPPVPSPETEYLSVAAVTALVEPMVATATSGTVVTTDPRLSDARDPTGHTHPISDCTGLQAALDGKAAVHAHPYAPVSHGHTIADTGGLQAALDGKSDTGHTHPGSSGTWGGIGGNIGDQADLVSALAGKAPTSHSHAIGDTTGLQTALDGKQAAGSYATAGHNHSGVYDPAGTAAAAVVAHEALGNPHPVYLTQVEGDAAYPAIGHSHSGLAPTGGSTNQVLKKASNANYDYAWAADATGAGGGNAGTAEVDFGAFPGKSDASFDITGQSGILSGSSINVQVAARATSDHSADECMVESVRAMAGNVVAGTGFTVYVRNDGQLSESRGGMGTLIYGKFAVNWQWV